MLRLALSRAPRRLALPSAARWTRFNSNQSTPPSANAAEQSQQKQKPKQKQKQKGTPVTSKKDASKPEEVVYEASAEETLSFEELEKELNETGPGKAAFSGPEKLGETEAELFGSTSSSISEPSPSKDTFLEAKLLDPARLPLTAPLGPNPTEAEVAATLIHGRGIHMAYQHPKTHNVPVAVIHFRSHHPKLLELFTHFASHAASSLGIPTSRVASLPTQRSLWTVLRSPFVHKKRQENFERKVHKRAIKAWDADGEVVERWTKYLRKHALGGVGMRIVKWERLPVSVGRLRAEEVEKQLTGLKPAEIPDREKIQQLGKKILIEEMGLAQQTSPIATRA